MYQKWHSKPYILSRVSPGHLYYLFLDLSPTYFSKIFVNEKNLENRTSENLKFQKPRFTNKCPVGSLGSLGRPRGLMGSLMGPLDP